MTRAVARQLPGERLHLHDGPIDLVISAEGDREAAFAAAVARFDGVLDELCAELPELRRRVGPGAACRLRGPVARRMHAAVAPHAALFITPMAAVAGAVAEAVLAAMLDAAALVRASVNNGGDIALHLAPGRRFRVSMALLPDGVASPGLFGQLSLGAGDGVRGIATSGWRGRSFSRGIADAVTVLAATAADADAAATIIANAVDLLGHPAIARRPACDLQADSDLGSIPVTVAVGPLGEAAVERALRRGLEQAEALAVRGLIHAAALHLRGRTCVTAAARHLLIEETAHV